ncbi:MAG: YkgJ family cysteine cluster protein [Candidatus Peribacteraceae bacterium]|jgi:Fe-S-cluster containining protein
MNSPSVLSVDSCENCGACCIAASRLPIKPHEVEALPQDLRDEVKALLSQPGLNDDPSTDCMWFDIQEKKCQHYEYRPEACRNFKKGGDTCKKIREYIGVI